MKVWGKRDKSLLVSRGIASVALEGASREELFREVLQALSADQGADRFGVWIESPQFAGEDGHESFRGALLDRGGEAIPSEWARLSPEAALPAGVLDGGKSVEQDLQGSAATALIGPLVGMRRALWVPVSRNGRLRGVLLAATRAKNVVLPQARLKSIAAQLELVLEFEQVQRIVREHQADDGLTRRVLADISSGAPPDVILAKLVQNCTETGALASGTGVAFAVIGVLPRPYLEASAVDEVQFLWKSGNESWTRAIESEPLASVWRRSLQDRRVSGCDTDRTWARGEVDRIIAIPIEAQKVMSGLLVAGLRPGTASLALLERLELRGVLAGAVLAHRLRRQELRRQSAWRHALLEVGSEAAVLVDSRGQISAASPAARELLPALG
ncbi:MAG: hypothetical protein ACRD36_03920, partial [Candidatus Acidiferrum sp.]